MYRSLSQVFSVTTLFLVALTGCSSNKQQWEVTVENKSDLPCSFFITLRPRGGDVKVEAVEKGKTHSLIVGDSKTVVESVKVVRGKDEQTLTPKAELPIGKRYAIVVEADGKVAASISDR